MTVNIGYDKIRTVEVFNLMAYAESEVKSCERSKTFQLLRKKCYVIIWLCQCVKGKEQG